MAKACIILSKHRRFAESEIDTECLKGSRSSGPSVVETFALLVLKEELEQKGSGGVFVGEQTYVSLTDEI